MSLVKTQSAEEIELGRILNPRPEIFFWRRFAKNNLYVHISLRHKEKGWITYLKPI